MVLALVTLMGGVLAGTTAAGAQADTQSFVGTMLLDGQPVAGVVVAVEQNGAAIGRATSGADGQWEVAVPAAGKYVITLDVATLPEGVGLESGDQIRRELTVSPLQGKPVPFNLARGGVRTEGASSQASSDDDGGSNVRRALQLFVEGLKFGLIIAMCAVGLSLIFGTTGLTNFAHGELVTLGALLAYFFNVRVGLNLVIAGILAVILCFFAGIGLERGFFAPLRRRGVSLIAMMVITIGVSIFVRYVFLYIFGGRTRAYDQYAVQQGLEIGPVKITPAGLIVMALSILVLGAVGLSLQKTRIGKAMRAVADNRDLASSSGIDVQKVILLVWGFGAALAGLGGVVLGLTEQAGWESGAQLLLLMFAGVTLGGLGTAYGALVGCVLVGIFIQMSTLVIPPELKTVGALGLLIVVLIFRPQGILGQRERIG